MRPLRLDLEGFTAFREPVTLDLEGADLFALVGPTGAGKSSVLDAICFALYGSVPRLDRRTVAPVISTGLNEARVGLTFAVGSQTYTAARVVRRQANGGATTKEARLERGDETLAGDADGVTREVEALLGLGFEQFTTCVLLPQGEFARFLHEKPAGRQALLVRLLELEIYGRMREAANVRRQAAEVARAAAEGELERLAGATPDALEEAEVRIGELESLRQELDAAQPKLDGLREEARAAERQRATAAQAAARLAAVTIPEGLTDLAEQAAAANQALAVAEAGAAAAEEEVGKAEHALAALGERGPLERARAAIAERAQLQGRIGRGEPIVARSRKEEETALAAAGEAELGAAEAADALEAVRLQHRAADLAAGLAPDDPCPVCHRPLTEAPEHPVPPDLASAQAGFATARRRAEELAARAAECAQQRVKAEAQLGLLGEQVEALDVALAGQLAPDEVDRLLAAITAAEAEAAAAREAERAARACARAAREEVTGRGRREAVAWEAFDAARDGLAALAPPPADRADLGAAWTVLAGWAAERAPYLRAEEAEAGRRSEGAVADLAALREELDIRCRELGVEPGERPRDACVDALAAARAHSQALARDLKRAAVLREEVAGQTEREAVAGSLRQHLTANGFERWLLDEALDRLATGASEALRELSAGQYSLAVDAQRNFLVVDHRNADEQRPARTLSGGETFLASLALALALASHLGELATTATVRLESIFLDEGFGTLDAETLDVVAAALEELGAAGRTVGLVTHIRDLAERLPVRFEVHRGPSSSTVERVVA